MSFAGLLLPLFILGSPTTPPVDPYDAALTAAVHHFAREGELGHLQAILDRHPKLVDAEETFPPGHKPYATEGYTPLEWAASQGHEAVAEYLIGHGANVNATGSGFTPLLLAARDGHLGMVKLLVAHGADLDARTEAIPETTSDSLPGSPGRDPSKPAEPPKIYPAIPSRTSLDWAVSMGHTEVADYLRSVKK